ncbi:hypothetical protein SSX86_022153 [Deinandra increscens subsp. villosa]|uniref:Bifunctional inhibitor/plant lipid transfer protein/seed storage helical domain-containing protein n=1 Tax=Deinandra increscens subsp. villosa TaxID=3103831 RepID=A0AAP0CLU1_9ASTR
MGSNRREAFGLVVIMIMVMIMPRGKATTECRSAVVSLSPCINYVCGNSSTPSYSCCSQLANVVKSQPQCLCALIGGHGNSAMGVKINQTMALRLPVACSVHTPPVTRCSGNETQTDHVPAKSDGTTIKQLEYYFSFASLLVALNMYV